MSVIAWDGKTLAADRFAEMCGISGEAQKLFLLPSNEVVGFTGPLAGGMELLALYRVDRLISHWPESQKGDDWSRLVVGKMNGTVVYYEKSPAEIPIYGKQLAWGSGQDFALTAMSLGQDAALAVSVTNLLCSTCGHGVTAFTYEDGFWRQVS